MDQGCVQIRARHARAERMPRVLRRALDCDARLRRESQSDGPDGGRVPRARKGRGGLGDSALARVLRRCPRAAAGMRGAGTAYR